MDMEKMPKKNPKYEDMRPLPMCNGDCIDCPMDSLDGEYYVDSEFYEKLQKGAKSELPP